MAADEWIEMASAALDKLLPPHKNKKAQHDHRKLVSPVFRKLQK
jgi:hypothetical protein